MYRKSASDALTRMTKTGEMLLQLVQTGRYDLPGGTQRRDSTMTSVQTWNELMRKEQSMKYEEGWNKIDHFISLNTVQKQPHQPEELKQYWPHTSPQSSSSPSWRWSCHAIETFALATGQLPLPPEEFTQPGRASSDPGDPTMDEYHRSADKTKPNEQDKKTMTEKSKSKSSDTTFQYI